MEKFIIMVDVISDLNQELRERFDIEYINGHMTTPDGKELKTYLEWKDFTSEEFYNSLKKNPNGYSTSPASPEEVVECYSKYLDQGYDILSFCISSALSGTYNFVLQAIQILNQKYPERKIYAIDTLRYSTGLGLLAVKASQLRSEGMNIDQVRDYIEENKFTCHQMGFLDDLSFVASKGRISKPKAFMGRLIGIKPMGEFDYNGLTTPIYKAKGDKAAIDVAIKYMEKTIIDPENQIIFIASTNRMKQALEYKNRIEETFKPKEVIITEVFAANGINVGPGLMASYYFGKKISKDLVEEKKIMEEITAK